MSKVKEAKMAKEEMMDGVLTSSGSSRFRQAWRKLAPSAARPFQFKSALLGFELI